MAIFFWLMLMLLPVDGMITATGLVGMLLTRKSVHNPQLFRGMKHFTFWGLGATRREWRVIFTDDDFFRATPSNLLTPFKSRHRYLHNSFSLKESQ